MVFPDIYNSQNSSAPIKTGAAAHIVDRFFSFLIDYMVISPFVLFLLYLSFHDGFTFWKANPAAPENTSFVFILGAGYVFYFSLLQSFFIVLWRATPGQHFLKIRLQPEEGDSLLAVRALFRQLGFWISFAALGIPFLATLTNPRRLTFYDRLSGLSVTTLKNEKVFFGFEVEFRYWRSLLATLVLFSGFLGTALLWKSYEKILARAASFAQLEEKNFFCPELKNVSSAERLQVAVGLNLGGQFSDACLDREADFVLWKQKAADVSLAYYAKSLTAADPSEEESYLREACAGESDSAPEMRSLGCRIADAFRGGRFEELYGQLDEGIFLTDVLKYELGQALGYGSDAARNWARIEKYNSLKSVRKYQLTELLARLPETGERTPAAETPSLDKTDKAEILRLIEGL